MLFALDLGNKQAKGKSAKREIVLPSRFLIDENHGEEQLLGFAIVRNSNKTYKLSKRKTFYKWGKDLNEGIIETGLVDTMAFGAKRYKSENFGLLVDFMLAELAQDYASAKKSFLEVEVSTGLPTEDYYDLEAKQAAIDAFIGDHLVYVNDVPVNIRVTSVEVTTQPMGTIGNEIADSKGVIKENPLATANIGVVDIGGGTFLADALRNFVTDKSRKSQLAKGAYLLYMNIKGALSKEKLYPNEHEIEKIVRDGNEKESYWYSPDGERKFNITETVMEQREKFTKEVIGDINAAYKGFGRIQLIFVTGGGANLLIKNMLEKELGIVYFVEESEMANVRGFYKQGLLKQKQLKEQLNNEQK